MFQLVGLLLFVTTTLVSAYAGGVSTIQLSDPKLASDSSLARDLMAGEQILVTTTAYRPPNPYYNDTEPFQFLSIIITRDSDGTTQSIAFQSVTMTNEQVAISTSWIPPEPGIYYLIAFAISELGENSIILSPTVQSTVTVV